MFPGADGGGDFENRLLAVAQEKSVKKIGQRFRVIGAGTASDDQRKPLVPILRLERDAGKIQNIRIVV